MGRAIVGGLMAEQGGEAWEIHATLRHAERAARLAHDLPSLTVGTDNVAAARSASIVLLATKPQAAGKVLRAPGMEEALDSSLMISLCAGVRLEQLEAWAPTARHVRAMSNTPALIREGMTVLAPGERATPEDLEIATEIFAAVGRVRVLEERYLDAVTGLSGSGPAFASVIVDALSDGGVMMGLPRDVATELAAQTLQGAARMVLQTGIHPAALRDQVTTPAGCTIAGLFMMEEGRVRSTMARTVQEAARVASGLGGPCDDDPSRS